MYNQMCALLSSPVFIYPEILPESRFIDRGPEKLRRVGFSPAEDVWVTSNFTRSNKCICQELYSKFRKHFILYVLFMASDSRHKH